MACFQCLEEPPGQGQVQDAIDAVHTYNIKWCSGFAMSVNRRRGMKARTETEQNCLFKWIRKCLGTPRGIPHLRIVSRVPRWSHLPRLPSANNTLEGSIRTSTLYVFFFLLSMLQMHLDWNMCQRRFDNDTQTSSTACCPFKWFRGKRKKTVICSWEKPNNKLVSFQRDRAGHLLETKARMWLPVLPLWLTSAVNWGTLCGFQKLPLSCGR